MKAWSRNISSFLVFSSIDIFSKITPFPISPGPSLPDGQVLASIEPILIDTSDKFVHGVLLLILVHEVHTSDPLLVLALQFHLSNELLSQKLASDSPGTTGSLAVPLSLSPAQFKMENMFCSNQFICILFKIPFLSKYSLLELKEI